MNKTERIAEEIIKIAYDKGGLVNGESLTEEQIKATNDNAINYVMRLYVALLLFAFRYHLRRS